MNTIVHYFSLSTVSNPVKLISVNEKWDFVLVFWWREFNKYENQGDNHYFIIREWNP